MCLELPFRTNFLSLFTLLPSTQGLSDIPDLASLCLRCIPTSLIPRRHFPSLESPEFHAARPFRPPRRRCVVPAQPPDPGFKPAASPRAAIVRSCPTSPFSSWGASFGSPQSWFPQSLGPLTSGQGGRCSGRRPGRHQHGQGGEGRLRRAGARTAQSPRRTGRSGRPRPLYTRLPRPQDLVGIAAKGADSTLKRHPLLSDHVFCVAKHNKQGNDLVSFSGAEGGRAT